MTQDLPVALVLGAAVRPGGEPSPALRRRAQKAAALFHAGQVRAIIASGAAQIPGLPSEASVIARVCAGAGVPDEALHIEDAATNTEENLLFSAPFVRALSSGRVVIVTDAWHGPRACLVARRQGLCASLAVVPLKGTRPRSIARGAVREMFAFCGYWLTGRGRQRPPDGGSSGKP